MRQFRLIIGATIEIPEAEVEVVYETARNIADEVMGEVVQCDNVLGDSISYDLAIMPREPGQVTITPPAGVVHPWDQGAWIFPVDHPLRSIEERAKAGDEDAHKILDRTVEAVKELNP